VPRLPPPIRLAFALAVFLAASLSAWAPAMAQGDATAQTDAPAVVPPELSDEARRKYAQGLKEVRELIARKDYAEADARIDALLAQRPREAQARFLKGVVQTARGETEAAIATFRALTEDYPELPEPYNNLAVLYAQKGDYNGARIALETALAAAPDFAVAHENLGDIYARLAAANYDRAAALDKGNKSAPAKLVLVRQLLGTN
jgi:tetratricopeptide (TPR) repeat protein